MDSPGIFFALAMPAAFAGALAWLPSPRDEVTGQPTSRIICTLLCVIALLPVLVHAWIGRSPQWAALNLSIEFMVNPLRELWLASAALFFAGASLIVSQRNRRAMRLLTIIIVIYVAGSNTWRLTTPAMYAQTGRIHDGVCLQSTSYTCGAASMVTLLREMGIDATEGEMARLSRTATGRGVDDFRAALGLQIKLRDDGRPEQVSLRVAPDCNPNGFPTPFLAGLKHSWAYDHMVCVLDVDHERDAVTLGDPLQGKVTMPIDEFRKLWRGVAVVVE